MMNTQKNRPDETFEHPKQKLKLMDNKTFTILR